MRHYASPERWTDEELEVKRREAIRHFVDHRLAEGTAAYVDLFEANRALVARLLDATGDLATFHDGAALAAEPALLVVARYLAAVPISDGDLNNLTGMSIAGRKRLNAEEAAAGAAVIAGALDPIRFAWLADSRAPTTEERELALRWTAGLRSAAQAQMVRRSESAERQEAAVRQLLLDRDYDEVPRRVITLAGGLEPRQFTRESLVAGRKADVPVGLTDGRFLLLECKVSNTGVNSVKRLNNDVAVKARHWAGQLGQRAVTGAVLAGVFELINLRDAQEAGVAIFWEHDLRTLDAFLARTEH